MRTLVIGMLVLLLATQCGVGKVSEPSAVYERGGRGRANTVIWFDDMETGAPGWYSLDESGQGVEFHVDSYLAYPDGTPPDHSWWCGRIDPSYAGGDGYGDNWDQTLSLPVVDLSLATYPVLTFIYRHDSEVDWDLTHVQAESQGVFVDLNSGYDGIEAWTDIGTYGFVVTNHDNPLRARFHFTSDGAWSDADFRYNSDGGAFMCDEIKVFDYFGGYVYFFDDAEDGVGLCTPSGLVIPPGGDWWRLVNDPCSSYSPPHSWWCGDPSDSSLIPPNLANTLYSPVVPIHAVQTCTLSYAIHFEVPPDDNDHWVEAVSLDAGTTWVNLGNWWGDAAQCGGWIQNDLDGHSLTHHLPGTGYFQFKVTFYTTDDGCGPAIAGAAGINVDDVLLEGKYLTGIEPGRPTSWSCIKAMYRE